MKKYKLIKANSIEKYGRTLFQIQALRSFGGVVKGDYGGYIEKEENLSYYSACWVYKEGIVLSEGRVVSGGEVSGGEVWGGVVRGGVVSGGVVSGGVVRGGVVSGGVVRGGVVRGGVVSGGVFSKNNFQVQGSRHFVNISRPNHLQIGCHEHTFDDWMSNFKSTGKSAGYSKKERKEYFKYIKMAISFPNQPSEQ